MDRKPLCPAEPSDQRASLGEWLQKPGLQMHVKSPIWEILVRARQRACGGGTHQPAGPWTHAPQVDSFFFFNFYLFIYGCVVSSFLCEGFL